MRNALELNDAILDMVTGGAKFRRDDYVESRSGLFGGLGMISQRQINERGENVYTVFSLEKNRVFENVSEKDLMGL